MTKFDVSEIVDFFSEHKNIILYIMGGMFIYGLYLIITRAPR